MVETDFDKVERSLRHVPCAHGGRKEHDTGTFLDFSANVNPLAPCAELTDMMKKAIGRPEVSTAYPDSSYMAARRSIAAFEGLSGPEIVLPTNGAIELISLFFSTFVRSGGRGIITTPTFCEYERFLRQSGGSPDYCPHNEIMESGLADAIIERVHPNTCTMALCNPNNPTGDLVRAKDILSLADELDGHDIMMLIDEAFIDLRRDQSLTRLLAGHENVVVCRSLTKILGIPGIRAGYGVGHHRAMGLMRRHQMPWSVNSLSREVLESLDVTKPFIDHSVAMLGTEQAWLSQELATIPGLSIHPSSAWYIMVKHSKLSSQRLVSLLRDKGILARGCHSFVGGDPNSIRLAVRGRNDNIKMLAALRAVCTWN